MTPALSPFSLLEASFPEGHPPTQPLMEVSCLDDPHFRCAMPEGGPPRGALPRGPLPLSLLEAPLPLSLFSKHHASRTPSPCSRLRAPRPPLPFLEAPCIEGPLPQGVVPRGPFSLSPHFEAPPYPPSLLAFSTRRTSTDLLPQGTRFDGPPFPPRAFVPRVPPPPPLPDALCLEAHLPPSFSHS